MVAEIQGKSAIPVAMDKAKPQATATAVPAANLEAALTPIKKAEIKVDIQQSQQNLQASLDHLNQVMRDGGRNIGFSIDHSLNGPVITVRKDDTGEVIRQIPNAAAINVAHSIDALKGLLLNAKI
jgi:flagellar protein FlaG